MKTSSITLLIAIFFLSPLISLAQNTEVDKLKKDLAAANARADRAEANAKHAMEESMKFQKYAEECRAVAERAEASAIRGRYICAAKLISIKSLELTDPQQEALVALLAYKFNTNYKGDPADHDIYRGLITALNRVDPNFSKNYDAQKLAYAHISDTQCAETAASLCKHVTRNMTTDEWTNFAGSDLKQEKVCGE